MHFELVEPVRQLFKDEVRQAGLQLGLPKEIVYRQPFPDPGLAVRILGEVTPERLRILRDADTIVQSEMEASDWYYRVWQSFAVLLPVQTVGVMGDQRTYDYTIALRIVESQDGMTADWVRLPYELLARISNRIVNEVKGVNRVVYDISTKPPSTIEWGEAVFGQSICDWLCRRSRSRSWGAPGCHSMSHSALANARHDASIPNPQDGSRQAAANNRLAACAPQVEVASAWANGWSQSCSGRCHRQARSSEVPAAPARVAS